MNLNLDSALGTSYTSGSQVARVLTEHWCARELYCPGCDRQRLSQSRTNTPAIDFFCDSCEQQYQLKAQRNWNLSRIVDGAYSAMLRAVTSDRNPNLFILQYSSRLTVENLILIPRTFFTADTLECRQPLGPRARRAGWVGCNILLKNIPASGKISIVADGRSTASSTVRQQFARALVLSQMKPAVRGWALAVLEAVHNTDKKVFSLNDVYAAEGILKTKYPHNSHIRPKIRQQLQVLRDAGFLAFEGKGHYRLCR